MLSLIHIFNQLMTNWGLTKTLSLDAGASYNIVDVYKRQPLF